MKRPMDFLGQCTGHVFSSGKRRQVVTALTVESDYCNEANLASQQ